MKGLNLLFIVGDVFDRIMPVNHRDVPYIVSWIRRLLARCAALDITVIVLEGTPSHDRLQSHLFTAINDSAEPQDKCDLTYVKEVDIIHIPKYDIDVLCIPDEKNTSDEVTYEQVLTMMKARAIEKVDFALMHGFFEFQVPAGRHSRFHISDRYLDLVRYLIHIGHDHEFQQRGRIIVQGSPDRQRHGMETDKGFVRSRVHRDGTYRSTFEVNEYAMVFKTIEVPEDVDTASSLIHDVCDALPMHSHVRLAGRKGNSAISAIDHFQSRYPFIRFTKKYHDEEEVEGDIIDVNETEEYVPFTIDSSNIKEVIFERLNIELITDEERMYFDNLIESVK